jgi:hypothetical protein
VICEEEEDEEEDDASTERRGEQGPDSTGGATAAAAALPRLESIGGRRSPTPLPGPTRSQTGRRTLMNFSVSALDSP